MKYLQLLLVVSQLLYACHNKPTTKVVDVKLVDVIEDTNTMEPPPPPPPVPPLIDPTGSYMLDSDTTVKDGEIYGYFGEIKVKPLSKNRIVVRLSVNKGAPSYNSGSFIDTLKYEDNKAIYTPEDDSTCKIQFSFAVVGVTVTQEQKDPNFGCGFGHGVFADGFYKRTSMEIPVIEESEE